MKSIDKHRLNDDKQTVNYPTDMKPEEAYFFRPLGVIVATMPHGKIFIPKNFLDVIENTGRIKKMSNVAQIFGTQS